MFTRAGMFSLAIAILLILALTPQASARIPIREPVTQQDQGVELVSQIGGASFTVAADGDYVYLGVGLRLVILNVSDPANPTVVGKSEVLPDVVEGVAVRSGGQHAYVADGYGGLWVIDISNPSAPSQAGFSYTWGWPVDVAVRGDHAYVADSHSGLALIDVSNPWAPVEVGRYDTPGCARGVAVAPNGQYAYVADDDEGLRVVDISNPSTPVEVGFCDTPGVAWNVAISAGGTYAYVADEESGLRVIDVSNPFAPVEVGFYDIKWAEDVAVSPRGDYIYVTGVASGSPGVEVIDVSDPSALSEVAFYDAQVMSDAIAVSPDGQYAYLANGYEGGLRAINVSSPSMPAEVGAYETLGVTHSATVLPGGQYVYAIGTGANFWVVDVSNPWLPADVGRYEWRGTDVVIPAEGSYAYITNEDLLVIDISNQQTPVEVGLNKGLGGHMAVSLGAEYAYVANGDGGLQVIDISGSPGLIEVGSYQAPGGVWDIVVLPREEAACVTDGSGDLRMLDISNPSHPVEVGFYDIPEAAESLAVSPDGRYIYVLDGDHGPLRVIDVSNFLVPIEAGLYETPNTMLYGVTVPPRGQYAYLAAGMGGLRVIDFSNPSSPTEVGSYSIYHTPGMMILQRWEAVDVAITDPYVYVAGGAGGLLILRLPGGELGPSATGTPEVGAIETLCPVPTSMPSVQSIQELITHKEQVIKAMEHTGVDILGSPASISAYDEQMIRDLIQSLRDTPVTPQQEEAFARLVIQEDGLSQLLTLAGQSSADLADTGVDIAGVVFSLHNVTDRTLEEAQEELGQEFPGAVLIRRAIERQCLNVLNSFGQASKIFIGDPVDRQDFEHFWFLLMNAVRMKVDAGESVQDILLKTAVKGELTQSLIRLYVSTTQAALEQGGRSASPDYQGGATIWQTKGTRERADMLVKDLVDLARIEAENAHSTHDALMKGANLVGFFTDFADLGTLTPSAGIPQIVSLIGRVEHLSVDALAIWSSASSWRCTRYLAQQTGSLAFNSDQPGTTCYSSTESQHPETLTTYVLAVPSDTSDGRAWIRLRLQLASDRSIYERAVEELLMSLQQGDHETIENALVDLDEADRRLGSTLQGAEALIYWVRSGESLLDLIEGSIEFAMDDMALYASVASYLTAPKNERKLSEVQQSAQQALLSLSEYDQALSSSTSVGGQAQPLPVITGIDAPDTVVVSEPFTLQIEVRNVGSARLDGAVVTVESPDGTLASSQLRPLDGGDRIMVKLDIEPNKAGVLSLLVRLQPPEEGILANARIVQIQVLEDEGKVREGSLCCSHIFGLLGIALIMTVWRVRR